MRCNGNCKDTPLGFSLLSSGRDTSFFHDSEHIDVMGDSYRRSMGQSARWHVDECTSDHGRSSANLEGRDCFGVSDGMKFTTHIHI